MVNPSTPWLNAAEAFRLHAWSETQSRSVVAAFEQACATWAGYWGLAISQGRLEPVGCAASSVGWVEYGEDAGAHAWFRQWPARRCAHERIAFGVHATRVTEEIVRDCRGDWQQRMLRVLGVDRERGPCSALPQLLASAWSGAFQFSVGDDLLVVADAAAVRHLLASCGALAVERSTRDLARLCAIDEALEHIPIDLDMELAGCEVDASALLGLAAGDVVCLPHDLDAPVQVCDVEGRACLGGDLRRQASRRAVQLRAPATNDAYGRTG